MPFDNVTPAQIYRYQFDVSIKRSTEKVWTLMTDEINSWWMNDFRALGEKSLVTLEAKTGGQLLERGEEGQSLEWYRVQMCQPQKALYLVGYLAPDWGGPTMSMLKLAIAPNDDSCILSVSDALMGNVSEKSGQAARSGWETLFRDGLGRFAEA